MIYFSDFGASAVSYSIAVIPIATGTSTGSPVNYTSSAITGLTPAGALVIGSNHLIANGAAGTVHAAISIGAVVGTTDYAITAASKDNVASTDTDRGGSVGSAAYLFNPGSDAVSTQAAGATISGGISLNYSVNAFNRRFMAVAFAGAGTSAFAGTVALGTGTTAITVSGVGFQPDVVILFGHNDDFAAGLTTLLQYTFGFATGDGTQRCVVGVEVNTQAAGAPFQALLTDCAGGSNNAAGAVTKLVVGGFGADGFTITPDTNQGSDDIAYLALKFTGQSVKIINFATPTATGSQAITGVGFRPQFVMAVLTNLEANDSVAATTSDLQSGLGISFIGNESWASSLQIDSGADPTSTSSNGQNYALMGSSATDNDAIIASLTSFDADGLTLNYSAVQGTAKKGFMLCVQ